MTNIISGATSAVDSTVGINRGAAGAGQGPTSEEGAALNEQQQALRDARQQILNTLRQQNLLSPQLLASLGFTTGPDGQITDQGAAGGTMAEMFGGGPEQQRINTLLRQRQIDALGGNAVDPNLEHSLATEEQTLRNQLRAQLGSTYETSTPGMQALSEFGKRAAESRYAVGRDVLTNAAGLANTNYLTAGQLRSQRVGDVFNASNLVQPTLTALNQNTAGFAAPVGELGTIFQRGVTAQLTQEQTRAQHGRNVASMF